MLLAVSTSLLFLEKRDLSDSIGPFFRFKYAEGVPATADRTATANVKLNDCPLSAEKWAFNSVFTAGEQDQGNYTLSFVDNGSTAACKGLTPSFERVLQASR